MKVKLATKRIGALALSLLIGLGSCVTTNIQKAYATDELESQASDSVSSATTSGGDAVTLADALGDEGEDTGIAPLGLGDQYTVTFNLNGGTLDPSKVTSDNQQVTVEDGQTVQNPGYPVKYESNGMGDYINMYKLDKWTLDGEEYDFSTPVTSDIELTATYSQMYITFDGNGGLLTNVAGAFGPFTDQASVTKKVYKDILVTLFFTQGAREGYTFDGFDEKPDGTGTAEIPYSGDLPMLGKYMSNINYTSVGGDITFYAKWTQVPSHTVTFHLSGGTLDYSDPTPSADIVMSVKDGETVAKPATNPILYSDNGSGSGYRYSRLEKWTLNDNEYDFNTPVTSDLELDANYTPINVTLHGNGGLITSDDVIYQCGSKNFYDVEEVTLILNDLVQHQMSQVSGKRTGYKMKRIEYGKVWTQNADGSGVTMRYLTADESAGHIVKSTFGEYLEQIGYTDGDIDLYAQWVDSHQHTWNTNWSSDNNNHWHDAACGHDIKKDQAPHTPSDWVIDKQPTSSSEGLKHKECTVCHKVLETGKIAKIEIIIQPEATPTPSATPVPSATPTSEPKHEHEFSKEWTTNESSHWHDATCGHDVRDGEAPHTPSDWIVAKQPTETEEGYRYKECTVCYDVLDTEVIDRLSSMVIEVPEESDPQPVVEETVTEEPVETPAPVVTPAPTTKEDKVIVAPVFDNGDQDAENMQGAMGRFLEGVKTVAVVLSISLAAVLGILGLLLLILAAMRRVKVQNDRSGDYEESNFVTVYKTSVSTEGSRIAQLFRKNDRVWNVVIPEEVVADRVTDFFKVVLTKSFCKRYNGEQLIVIMDSEDDQVKKQFGFVIDGEDNEISITIKE